MALTIATTPPFGQIMAAYRPIVLSAKTSLYDNTEVVYADVYFNGAFYQTTHTTVWEKYAEQVSIGTIKAIFWFRRFQFDFQGVCQDFLRSRLPATIASTVIDYDASGIAKMQVRFRSGILNSTTGLLDVSTSADVTSNEILVVNAAVPHDSVPVLRDYLGQFKTAVWNSGTLRLMPMTECTTCFAYRSQCMQYPFLPEWDGLTASNNTVTDAYIIIEFQYKGSEVTYFANSDYDQPAGKFAINAFMINYLPVGIPQLRMLPWLTNSGFGPFWDQMVKWRIKLSYNATLPLVTPWYNVPPAACEDAPIVRFLNRLGTYDSVNFEEATLESDTTSSSFQSAVKSIPGVGGLRVRGRQRYNVRTGRRLTATTNLYPEAAQDWLSQLIDSPDVYIERPAVPGRPADFIPVVVEDAKAVLRKTEERYEYEQTVVFRYANDTPRQRM